MVTAELQSSMRIPQSYTSVIYLSRIPQSVLSLRHAAGKVPLTSAPNRQYILQFTEEFRRNVMQHLEAKPWKQSHGHQAMHQESLHSHAQWDDQSDAKRQARPLIVSFINLWMRL